MAPAESKETASEAAPKRLTSEQIIEKRRKRYDDAVVKVTALVAERNQKGKRIIQLDRDFEQTASSRKHEMGVLQGRIKDLDQDVQDGILTQKERDEEARAIQKDIDKARKQSKKATMEYEAERAVLVQDINERISSEFSTLQATIERQVEQLEDLGVEVPSFEDIMRDVSRVEDEPEEDEA